LPPPHLSARAARLLTRCYRCRVRQVPPPAPAKAGKKAGGARKKAAAANGGGGASGGADPSTAIKKPTSSYVYFCVAVHGALRSHSVLELFASASLGAELQAELEASNQSGKVSSQLLGKLWKALGDAGQGTYKEQAVRSLARPSSVACLAGLSETVPRPRHHRALLRP
jgi:hypothetical protein